jgi:ketosteroid isomerase-like protein
MKRTLLIAFAGLVLASTGVQATQLTEDEAIILQMEYSWTHAVSTGERNALYQLLDDSYTETTADGRHKSKLDAITAPLPPPGASQTLVDLQVHVNGDTAVVTGINRYRRSAADKAINFSFTDIFARRDGVWRVISSQMYR